MDQFRQSQKDPSGFEFIPAIIATDSSRVTCGTVFVVAGDNGDIGRREHQGFFAHDTRFLSHMIVRINGRRLTGVGHATFEDRLASFYCVLGGISIVRDRYVSTAFHEDINITNHTPKTVNIDLEIELDTDFADVFEVRRGNVKKAGRMTTEYSREKGLVVAYKRASFLRETRIKFSRPAKVSDNTARFIFKLAPKEIWKTCIDIIPVIDNHVHEKAPCVSDVLGKPFGTYEEKTFLGFFQKVGEGMPLEQIPVLKTEDHNLLQAYRRAVGDLRALRLQQDDGRYVLAAGLPWFVAVFGRDSIISAIQTKMLGPELMVGTLHTLAGLQAMEIDTFREAEPGKIIHEVRRGELSLFGTVPHTRYYGSVDATPLFINLLWETYEWTGDKKLLEDFLPAAELALEWIEKYGDVDDDGFVEYRRRISKGLLNQGWKDSIDSISFNTGKMATGPIALVEVQGYVYAAKKSMAGVYEELGNFKRAEELRTAAEQLKKRFDDAFWMPEHEFYAIALDGKKRRVDSISSNPGHCLWSGIIPEQKAEKVANRLMAPDIFSGWGIRTLSSEAGHYNPLSYHNGSIWPHDNSLIAAGLKRYGFHEQAARIAGAIIDAAAVLPSYRLPELFAGYPRRAYSFPVPYPAANAPQAWASGSVIYLMETLLGITAGEDLLVSATPADTGPGFTLSGVRYRNKKLALP